MGAIYGHGGHLDLWTMTICTYYQSTFNTRLHMKFEEIWLRDFRGEVVQRCERMDGHSHKCTLVGYFNSKKLPNKQQKCP